MVNHNMEAEFSSMYHSETANQIAELNVANRFTRQSMLQITAEQNVRMWTRI